MRKSKAFAVVGLVVGLLFALSACGTGGGGGDTVGIGSLLPQTGDLKELGVLMANSVELAGDVINESGGVLGGDVEIIAKDSGTTEATARDNASQLANVEGVPAFVGAAGSGVSKAALQVSKDNQIVQVSPSSTSPDFTTMDDGGMFFRTAPSDSLQGKAAAVLGRQEGYQTASVIYVNNPYGQAFSDVFVEAFSNMGGEILTTQGYDPQSSTFDSEVQQVVEAAPDVMLLITYPETGSVILQTSYQVGLLDSTDILGTDGLATNDLADKVGKDDEGNYIIEGIKGTKPKATGPAYQFFADRYEEKFGEASTGPFDAHSYDAGILVALAIEQAGEANGPAIAEALPQVASPPGEEVSDVGEALQLVRDGTEINYQGAAGKVDMDEVGDVSSDYLIYQFDAEGKMEDIATVTAEDLQE